jgi:hypothetical protein
MRIATEFILVTYLSEIQNLYVKLTIQWKYQKYGNVPHNMTHYIHEH